MLNITDTDRLDFLIANSATWNPRTKTYMNSMAKDHGLSESERPVRWFGGYWDDGHPNYGGGGDPITPETEDDDPRTALDLAILRETAKLTTHANIRESHKPGCDCGACRVITDQRANGCTCAFCKSLQ